MATEGVKPITAGEQDKATAEKKTGDWRSRLRQGSFKGVPFYCDDHERDGGRVWGIHEYPSRDLPYHEDIRKKATIFTINAYVLGPGYDLQRDALLAACESPGPGTLIHPFLGEYSGKEGEKPAVVCLEAKLSESLKRNAGMATIAITFQVTGTVPVPYPANEQKVGISKIKALKEAIEGAKENLSTLGPDFLKATLVNDLLEFAQMGHLIFSAIPDLYESTQVAKFLKGLQNLDYTFSTLVGDIPALANWISSTIDGIDQFPFGDTFTAFNAVYELIKFGDEDNPSIYQDPLETIPSTETEARTQQSLNREVLVSLIRQCAIAEACEIIVKYAPSSRQEMEEIRERMRKSFEDELIRCGDNNLDKVYRALRELRGNLFNYLNEIAGTLPQVIEYRVPPAVMSTLVLAYEKYENVSREQEILDRNSNIQHPGFLPAGELLELLSE